MPSNYWTEEMCLKEAKKYTSKVAFQKGSVTAYQVALRKGWIKDYDWFKRPEPHNKGKIKWTYDKCKAAFEDGEFTLKQIDFSHREEGYILLHPANPNYKDIRIEGDETFEVWGVVIWTIRSWRK